MGDGPVDRLRAPKCAERPRDEWRAMEDKAARAGDTLSPAARIGAGASSQRLGWRLRGIRQEMSDRRMLAARGDCPSANDIPEAAVSELGRLYGVSKIARGPGGDVPPELRA